MNKHSKLALIVAPFLAIGGFAAMDYYENNEAAQTRVFMMSPETGCDVINDQCVLVTEEFKINVMDHDGVTEINSTFPLDRATLFIVNEDESYEAYQLGMIDSPYYWKNATTLAQRVSAEPQQRLRLIAEIKGGKYISEFITTTAQ